MPSITSNKLSALALLTRLVEMPTPTSEKATSRAAMDWVKYQLAPLGLHVAEHTIDGYPALIMTTRKTKRPKVMFHAHMDVAPAPADFYKVTRSGGKLFGRGVFDMKSAIAAYMHVFLGLGGDLESYDLGIIITSDEEVTGGRVVANKLVSLGWGGQVILNPDAISGWNIQTQCKGIARYRIHSKGISGHSSRPWESRNAITQLIGYLNELAKDFPDEPCHDKFHGHPSLNVGVFHGGEIANQVPSSAYADIDIRIMPGNTVEQEAARLQELAAEHPYVTLEYLSHDKPLVMDKNNEYLKVLERVIETKTGVEPGLVLAHGGSESGFYMDAGMTVLTFGPPGGGHHSSEEWLDEVGFGEFIEVISSFVDEVAKSS